MHAKTPNTLKTHSSNLFSLAVAIALALPAWPAVGATLVLVEDGESRAPIVVFENAPPKTRRVADELAEYIERTSGARPEVFEGEPDPVPESAIWVGYQPVLDGLFPDIDFDFKHPEEILIAANDKHLVIAGRDVWDPDNLVVEGRNRRIVGIQQAYGTVNAVYTFLQHFLNVRWLWPGELGIDVEPRETLAFAPFQHRYHPQIRDRLGMFRLSALGDDRGISHEWLRLQRIQLGSLDVPGGHAFTDWWERFGATNPEFFALQPDGTRGGGDDAWPNPRTVKLCHSHPGVWGQWLADVEDRIRQNPTMTVFDAEPNDSWGRGHCICDDCRAWDHPEGELRGVRWRSERSSEVALSDRYITFANTVARRLRERYPDRNYYVRIGAYGHSRPAPIAAVPDDNVIVTSVANFLFRPDNADRGSPAGTLHRRQFADWATVAPNLYWRPNSGNPAWLRQGGPAVFLDHVIEEWRFVADKGCMGIFIDTIHEHWATQGPMYYLMGKLAWDPRQDGKAVLDDYFQRGFGPAAREIAGYWRFLEQNRDNYDDPHYYAQASGFLSAAREQVRDGAAKYGDRIDFVEMGLTFTRHLSEAYAHARRYRESNGADIAARDEARRIFMGKVAPIATCEQHPAAFNWRQVRSRAGGAWPGDLRAFLRERGEW